MKKQAITTIRILDQGSKNLCSIFGLVGLLYNRQELTEKELDDCISFEKYSLGIPSAVKVVESFTRSTILYNQEQNRSLIEEIINREGMVIRVGGGVWQSAVEPPHFLTIGEAGATGHFVYATKFQDNILTCVNSWGEKWGNGGLFYIDLSKTEMKRFSFWRIRKKANKLVSARLFK